MKQKKFKLKAFLIILAITVFAFYSCDGITTANSGITVTNLSLNDTELTVKLTSTAQLAATVEPEAASEISLIWATSDESIVTISDDGTATAVGAGTAEITVSTTDDSFSASASVTVLPILYGASKGNSSLGTSILYEIDSETGEQLAEIGDTGYYLNGLVYDNDNGKLYGTTSTNDTTLSSGLVEINTSIAAVTEIGSSGIVEAGFLNPAFSSSGTLYAWSENTDVLVTVNPSTAEITEFESSGVSTWTHGMDFDSSGNLYLINPEQEDESLDAVDVYSINTSTGAATFVKKITTDTTHVYAHHGKFNPLTGFFWGIDNNSGTERYFNILDVDAGSRSSTAQTINNLHSIAFRSK